jgi:C-terminal processing protease CtpA/Prc
MTTTAGDVVQTVYRALVRDSLVPSDGHAIATVAMRAMGREPRSGTPLPAWFGRDVERDATWLASQMPGGVPPLTIAIAMAWECGVPHTQVVDETFRQGMAALLAGEPAVAPGFALWRQADGRQAIADVDERGFGWACGLRAGDVLLTVDGRPLRRPNGEVMPFYTAAPGTRHSLRLDRHGASVDVDVVLAAGAVPSVTMDRLRDGTGHLRVRWFACSGDPERDTSALARNAIADLVADGARGIVVDVRSGMGGDVRAVAAIASALCDGDLMVDVVHGDGRRAQYRRTGPASWRDAPIAVLVNEMTVSAAEYLTLALQELAGAVVVGTPTAGGLNGIGFVDLGGGYALAMPSGRAVGPRSGVSLPGMRIEPHIAAGNPTTTELRDGLDPALEAARQSLRRGRR